MARKKLSTQTTSAPKDAPVSFTIGNVTLDRDEWELISNDLYQSVNASLNERSALEQNLKDWLDLYEMRVDEIDWPWVDASNIFIPVIPAQLDSMFSYISAKVFVPRFYIVTGNTPEAGMTSHDVERYYNAELVRQRGSTTWYDTYLTWLHMAFRDGTAIMEVLWRRTTRKRQVVRFTPVQNDGVPVIDMETGQPKMERKIETIDTVEYDDVELTPVLLRDFIIIPDEEKDINTAPGVAKAMFLYEDQLKAMTKSDRNPDGILDPYWVENALSYVPTGTNDYISDRQGNYDRTAGDQLVLGEGQGAQTSKFFRNRGPIKVWRIHTRQYDMNQDGEVEEVIFYLHELSQRMLGFTPYSYINPTRPFFAFCPFPRPDRFYGYSLCERLAPIQAEINGMYNARNNLIDLMLSPPLLYKAGDELDDQEQQWGPGVRWEVSDPMTSVKWMEFPQVPLASFQNEQLLNSYVDKLTGVAAPAMGAQSSGRRSATEMRQQAASTSSRNDTVALRLRIVCRAIFNFVHGLKLQYLNEDPQFNVGDQSYRLPRQVLAQDYQLDIAGSSDPLDNNERRRDNMGLGQMLLGIPWIGGDMVKSYNIVRMMLEAFNRPDVTQLIGTEQEAQQRAQAQAQQQQQMQKAQMLGAVLNPEAHAKAQQHAQQQGKPPGPPGGLGGGPH